MDRGRVLLRLLSHCADRGASFLSRTQGIGLAMIVAFAAAPSFGSPPPTHFMYQGAEVDLQLDASRIAVRFRSELDESQCLAAAAAAGVEAVGAERTGVVRWYLLQLAAAVSDTADAQVLVSALAADPGIEFAAPVFHGIGQNWVTVTQHISCVSNPNTQPTLTFSFRPWHRISILYPLHLPDFPVLLSSRVLHATDSRFLRLPTVSPPSQALAGQNRICNSLLTLSSSRTTPSFLTSGGSVIQVRAVDFRTWTLTATRPGISPLATLTSRCWSSIQVFSRTIPTSISSRVGILPPIRVMAVR